MSKFEVGDRVEVTGDVMGVQSFVFGKRGTVKDVGPVPQGPYVCVEVDGGIGWMEFFGCELTVVDEPRTVVLPDGSELWFADPGCGHDVQGQWSGVKCVKCGGWFCF